MRIKLSVVLLLLFCFAFVGNSFGQGPDAPKEMEVFKNDVGTWDCKIKFWTDPAGEAQESTGTETNEMLGGMWLISEFKGEFFGAPFQGSGQFGFNTETKKYVGSWVDSMSPHAMCMEGTWDAAKKTLTQFGTGKDPMGNDMKSKSTIVYQDKDNHVMTMFNLAPDSKDNWVKSMEITYKRKK